MDMHSGPRQGNEDTGAINHLPVVEEKGRSWIMSCTGHRAGQSLCLPSACKCQQKASIWVSGVAEGPFSICLVLAWT